MAETTGLPDGTPEASNSPAIAVDAADLKEIRSAVADAAGVSTGLWLSYLFVLFYLLIAAGAVTHRDLFFANPIKLPFLSVELPLKGFFWLGPALFLVVHGYVLLHFVLLSSKARNFDEQLRSQIDDAEVRAQLRRQLPINIFVQFLAGPQEVRHGLIGFLLRLIAWITLVIGPIALLVFFELQFLPYHDVWITMWQRIAVIIDLLLLWLLWPAVVQGETIRRQRFWPGWRSIGWGTGSVMLCMSLVSIVLIFAIATFYGEWLDTKLAWFPLRDTLIAGTEDVTTRKPTSLWSNRPVLPGFDVIDHAKFDTEAKIAAAPEMASLRGRHLEGAVLTGAVLRKVDFQGADLRKADLVAAKLNDANLTGSVSCRAGPFTTIRVAGLLA
jgi:Pentapeptide repeats (8 copies)